MQSLPRIIRSFVLLAPLAAAQDDPLQLIRNVAATYKELSKTSYDFEQVEIRDSHRTRTERRYRIVGSGGRYREEFSSDGPFHVSDGQHLWTYNPERNEYQKRSTQGGMPAGLTRFFLAAHRVKSARFLRRETLDLRSGPVICDVIEVEREPSDGQSDSPLTYWIDRRRNLVLKLDHKITFFDSDGPRSQTAITLTFAKATVGEPVDESLLRFTPPPGSVQVERLSFGRKSKLLGQSSPEVELKQLDGTVVSSASLKGRPVLLQFGPRASDDELLLVELLHRTLKPTGVTVVYVDSSRSPDKPSGRYSVPVATDPDGATAKKFGISYSGMVFIDRLGKIAYADSSSRNAMELVQALQTAGLW